jgi:hypothetical protein
MKNTFLGLFFFAVICCATPPSYGQDRTNQAGTDQRIFKGALLLVNPSESPYRLGSPMPASITITNIGQADIHGVYTSFFEEDYRVSVYSADGRLLRSPATVLSDKPRSRSEFTIKPGESRSTTLDLTRLTHIDEGGTYYLTIARRIATWDSGFVVSDKIKINVVKQKAE